MRKIYVASWKLFILTPGRYKSRTGSSRTASPGRINFTDMDDLEEGKISTIFLNEFASFQENDSFSRLEYIFAYFFILLQLFVIKQRSWGERDHKLCA